LVNEYDDIVELLNNTKTNYTLFVPVDSAFAHLPDHGDEKPSKEFIEAVLRYHIGLDTYTGRRILSTQTIPTALDEKFLGGEPQSLRTEVGLLGIRVNFYSKVIKANFVSNTTVNFSDLQLTHPKGSQERRHPRRQPPPRAASVRWPRA
jgi:uncharacterized surface protein with fasciclin (FAS1) repeats